MRGTMRGWIAHHEGDSRGVPENVSMFCSSCTLVTNVIMTSMANVVRPVRLMTDGCQIDVR